MFLISLKIDALLATNFTTSFLVKSNTFMLHVADVSMKDKGKNPPSEKDRLFLFSSATLQASKTDARSFWSGFCQLYEGGHESF